MLVARSVMRLAEQPARRLCVSGGGQVVALAKAVHRPRQALSLPRPGRRCGVNADAFNITGCYAKCRQSLAKLAWCRHRSGCWRNLRALRVRVTPVMSCAPPLGSAVTLSRCHAVTALYSQFACSRYAPARPAKATCPARPGGRLRSGCSPAGFRSRARRLPSRPPRQRGSPKARGENPPIPRGGQKAPALGLQRLAPCSPRQGCASPLRALDPAAARRC